MLEYGFPKNWSTLRKLVWLYVNKFRSTTPADPTSDKVGKGKVDYMVLTS